MARLSAGVRRRAIHDRGSGAGSDTGDSPRILKLIDWLDYVQSTGFNALQLAPVFASTTHGYDTEDYYRVDPRLGTEDDVVKLIAASHERGIKVLFDGVFNHIGEHAPALRVALNDPDAVEAELFSLRHTDKGAEVDVFEGHSGLVEFNHDSQATVDFVIGVMDYWLSRGVDGWRLDAAYAVDPKFWARVLPEVRRRHPDAYIYGEVIHGDYPRIVEESTMDSVTEYELWKAVWSSLKEENFFELEWTLKRHNGFLASFVPVTFIGNHDVTRIASTVGADKAVLAAAVLFTVGGLPLVYYGDEQGYTGIKEERAGGDDEVRPEFPASPGDFSSLGAGIFEAYQQLVALRRRYPWLYSARVEIDEVRNGYLRYRAVATDPELVGEAAGGMPALDITLSVENGATEAIIRDGDTNQFTYPF
nr:alpha-amylase family protein [Corynebacterium lactis]